VNDEPEGELPASPLPVRCLLEIPPGRLTPFNLAPAGLAQVTSKLLVLSAMPIHGRAQGAGALQWPEPFEFDVWEPGQPFDPRCSLGGLLYWVHSLVARRRRSASGSSCQHSVWARRQRNRGFLSVRRDHRGAPLDQPSELGHFWRGGDQRTVPRCLGGGLQKWWFLAGRRWRRRGRGLHFPGAATARCHWVERPRDRTFHLECGVPGMTFLPTDEGSKNRSNRAWVRSSSELVGRLRRRFLAARKNGHEIRPPMTTATTNAAASPRVGKSGLGTAK
jgi:hypothetical protein